MKNDKLIIYTDGGARGNPGPAGIGAVIYGGSSVKSATAQNEKRIAEVSKYIGIATNNQAEYKAAIAGLEKAKQLGAQEVKMYMDSELIVEQLNQRYKVKNKNLIPLFVKMWNLSIGFKKITYQHIRREMNKKADKLVNKAINRELNKKLAVNFR